MGIIEVLARHIAIGVIRPVFDPRLGCMLRQTAS
jgi:hypothetical protein